MAKELQKHMSKEHRKHGVIDQGKYRKRVSKIKWIYIQYHVQDNADVEHKDVKIYCDTNQFSELPLCGPHPKPHRARGLSKNYHLHFDPKLDHGIYTIFRITCACVACISMLDKNWVSVISSKKQTRYQHFIDCSYWSVLGSFNKRLKYH